MRGFWSRVYRCYSDLDYYLEDNQILNVGTATNMEVLHTWGIVPGSVCFVLRSSEKHIVFSGDTLFRVALDAQTSGAEIMRQ